MVACVLWAALGSPGEGAARRAGCKSAAESAKIEVETGVLHPEDRAGERARVAMGPAAAFDLVEEIAEGLVEEAGLLDVEGVPGIGKDDERGAGDQPLHQEAGFEAGVVLVAGRDERRHRELFHLVGQIPQRGAARLDAAHRVGGAAGRMLGELGEELGIAARVLVEVLHAGRPGAVGLGDFGHAVALDFRRGAAGFIAELLALVGLRAVAAAGDDQGGGAVGIGETEMQHGKAAHRDADDVRLRNVESVEHGADVVARPLLRILIPVLRHVGGRIAARVERDAAVAPREIAQLRLVAADVAGEFVDEDDRVAGAGFLVIEADAVVGGEVGHYSAACGLLRTVLAMSFWRSNSARRRAISSAESSAILEKSSFQSGLSLQRSGDCTVVRGAGAASRTRSARSSVSACDAGSCGRPQGLPSGKSLKRKRGTPAYSTMSLAHPMTTVGMPLASR